MAKTKAELQKRIEYLEECKVNYERTIDKNKECFDLLNADNYRLRNTIQTHEITINEVNEELELTKQLVQQNHKDKVYFSDKADKLLGEVYELKSELEKELKNSDHLFKALQAETETNESLDKQLIDLSKQLLDKTGDCIILESKLRIAGNVKHDLLSELNNERNNFTYFGISVIINVLLLLTVFYLS